MKRGAWIGALLLGACSAQDGSFHDSLYELANPQGGQIGLGAIAALPPWRVHSPRECARLYTPGAAVGYERYNDLVGRCRREDVWTAAVSVASR